MSPRSPHPGGSSGNSLQLRAEPYATIEGAVARITFVSEESQYVVARLDVPGKPDPVTIVGTVLSLTPGETLRVHGRWSHHPKYGEQFRVERYESVVPATINGIQKYLGSGMIKGIGPVFAKRLVEAFGEETLKVIEEAPGRLAEVDGIGPIRQQRITSAWAEQREIREVMLFLQGHGVSPAYAVKIFKTYGQAAIATVREDPYRLARDIRGIGFKTADKIARELGIPADSPLRAAAGILHTLNELTDEGHVYVPEAELLRAAEETLEIPAALLPDALAAVSADEAVVVEPIPTGRAVYLTALHVSETQLARRVADLLRAPRAVPPIDMTQALAWVEQKTGLALTEEQRQAVRLAFQEKLLIVTGGPGTGKTTILQAIIRILEAKKLRMHLASPTGRAAKRLAEVTGHEATTLHRLLEWSPREGGFQRNSRNPLETDFVVVDEVSMIDVLLAHHLLRAIPLTATLLLVGDADQLPSVGPGRVLQDLLDVPGIPAIRLTTIFRQAAQSRIVSNAHRVNRGEFPDLSVAAAGQAQDFYFLAEEDPAQLQQLVVDLAQRRLPARYGLDPLADIQVLTPMHRGPIGAAQLNAALQAALNPPRPASAELLRGGRIFRVGDRVLQLRNNYDKAVFNGDLGRLTAIDAVEQAVVVQVDDREVSYDFSELDELTLAYAATVHKSQGSEYPAVILPLHTTHYPMLQRNLLYTAITRARRLLVVAGTKKALAIAVRNDATLRRASRLADRLVGFDRGMQAPLDSAGSPGIG
ncbi:MAG TPA: ATP-dependent RecD-like DNA helicase [Candidatus Methylomirabilis sp.]|nr:ATP-dependent RecD-like DNA helicase [Candidatus Methylomirabilis sp.]